MSERERKKFLGSERETLALGLVLATELCGGDIIKITGPLGAGKTTLVKGVVEGLGGNPTEVHSPTFSLVHHYCGKSIEIIHCDFYRLPNNSELEEFGGREFFSFDSIYLIEWAEQLGSLLSNIPNRLLHVDLQPVALGREARLFGPWQIVD